LTWFISYFSTKKGKNGKGYGKSDKKGKKCFIYGKAKKIDIGQKVQG